jgi:peptide/nickel transport system substrate-binding protein
MTIFNNYDFKRSVIFVNLKKRGIMTDKIEHFHKQFRQGLLPRRDFIKMATATGISMTALGSLLTTPVLAKTPKRGGRITVGVDASSTTDSLNPAAYNGNSDYLRANAVYDMLVNRGMDLLPEPFLAESWESNKDASKWVFNLKKGVEFHNGKNFTADDVIYSFMHHIGEKSESPAKEYFSQIKEMKKLDKHTIEFTLASPNADLPIILSDTRAHIIPDGYKDFTTTTIGTGPFKVKKFKPGSVYIFERNPNYWGNGGPFVDEIEYIGIGDPATRINALLSGDINLLMNLDPKNVPLIKNRNDMSVIQAKSNSHINIAMMLDRAPSNNKDLRTAMKYAVDRKMILQNVFKGYGHIGNDHPISPIDPYYNHDIPQRTYDSEKVRYYIKKAGLENVSVDLYTSDIAAAGAVSACEVLQETASAGGLKLNLIKPPADTYWGNIWMKKPICASGWISRPVPDLMFSIAYKSGGSYNETQWSNERFDKLLVEARGVTDFNKRKEMYGEMQLLLQEDGGTVVLSFLDNVDAAHKNVKGITAHPSAYLGFYQFATNVWLDS